MGLRQWETTPASIPWRSFGREKTLKGSYYGTSRPAIDFHRMVDLYNRGQIDVDGLITRTYTLDQINEAYDELGRGVVGRGVITFG